MCCVEYILNVPFVNVSGIHFHSVENSSCAPTVAQIIDISKILILHGPWIHFYYSWCTTVSVQQELLTLFL